MDGARIGEMGKRSDSFTEGMDDQIRGVYDSQPDLIICAIHEGRLVGVAAAEVSRRGQAHISHFFIASPYRRRYWGSQMWEEILSRLKERACSRVSVECDEFDLAARRFWDLQGLRPVRLVLAKEI